MPIVLISLGRNHVSKVGASTSDLQAMGRGYSPSQPTSGSQERLNFVQSEFHRSYLVARTALNLQTETSCKYLHCWRS